MKQSYKTNWAFPWTLCTVTASLGRMCFFIAFQQQSMLTTTHEPLSNIFVWKLSLPCLLCIYLTSMLVNFWSLTTSSAVIFKPLRPTNVVLQTFTFALMVHPMHIYLILFATTLTSKDAEGQDFGWNVADGKDPSGSYSACQHQRCWTPCLNINKKTPDTK